MNERNVEALTLALFQGQGQKPNEQVAVAELRGTGFEELARRLAARGILVPAAITPAEVKRMDPGLGCINGESGMEQTDCCEECANAWRSSLEKIAKGEAQPKRDLPPHPGPFYWGTAVQNDPDGTYGGGA